MTRLRHDNWAERYGRMVNAALDWLDRRFSPELAEDPPPYGPASSRAAWSAPLLFFLLVIALGYPLLGLIVQWAAVGEAAVGGLVIVPAEPSKAIRIATVSGIALIPFVLWKALTASRTDYAVFWMLFTFALVGAFAGAGTGAVTVAGAFIAVGAVTFAGAFAVEWLGRKTGRPTRLRLWIADGLEKGAAGHEQEGRQANMALVILCALSLSLPAILMAEGARWLWSGRADLRDGALRLCEWFALWLGQVP